MEALIRVTTDAQGALVVSARELHYFLETEDQFNGWFVDRVEKCRLIENQDYLPIEGGMPETDYALTLDAAKELAIGKGNEKGKQARQYFIDFERMAKAQAAFPPADLTQLVAMLVEQNLLLIQVQQTLLGDENEGEPD